MRKSLLSVAITIVLLFVWTESGWSFCLIGKDCIADGLQYRYGTISKSVSLTEPVREDLFFTYYNATVWDSSLVEDQNNNALITPVAITFKKSFFFFDAFSYQFFFDFSPESAVEGWNYYDEYDGIGGVETDTYGYVSQEYVSIGVRFTTELKWIFAIYIFPTFFMDTDNTFRWGVIGFGAYYTVLISKGRVEQCLTETCSVTNVHEFNTQYEGTGGTFELTLLEYNGDGFELAFGKTVTHTTSGIVIGDNLELSTSMTETEVVSYTYLF